MRSKARIKILAEALYSAAQDKQGKELEKVADNFMNYLKLRRLRGMIGGILDELELIESKQQGRIMARVIAKHELGGVELNQVIKLVELKTGKKAEVRQEADEGVMGGMVVRYEDKILDFSIKNKLKKLKEELSK